MLKEAVMKPPPNMKFRPTFAAACVGLALAFGSSGAAAGSCAGVPALTLNTFQNYQSQVFLFEGEMQAMSLKFAATPPYFQISNYSASTGAFSGIFIPAGGAGYAMTGSAVQVGTDGLQIGFSYNTNPNLPAVGASFVYSIALQLQSNCDVYFAGTYTSTYLVPGIGGRPPTRGSAGPFPFSGFAHL
jgi:hypothetical protein